MEGKEELEVMNQDHNKTDRKIMQNRFCRICFQYDNENYIKPCRCTGNSEFVHDKCLSVWVLKKLSDAANVKCEVCLEKLEFKIKKKCFLVKNIKESNDYEKYRNIIIFSSTVLVLSIIIMIVLKIYFANAKNENAENLAVGVICGGPVLLSVFYIVISLCKLIFTYKIVLDFKNYKKDTSKSESIEISV